MSSWGTIYNNTRAALAVQSRRLSELQEQAASGVRVNRASDDPPDAYRIMTLRAQARALSEYTSNLDDVTGTLELTHGVVEEVTGNLADVSQKLQQAASGTYNDQNRAILGEDIDAILRQVYALANTARAGRHLFSGAANDTPAFAAEEHDGRIVEVAYTGSSQPLPVPVAPGVEMPGAIVGREFFGENQRRPPELSGSTGAAAGSGTSTVRGNFTLELTHAGTSIQADPDGSGLQVSGEPGVVDTLLGEFSVVVDVGARTIAIDGGPATSFTGTETALAVAGPDGGFLHFDVTALNMGLGAPATVTVRADANASIDGGPATVIDDYGPANLAVADADGRVLYLDTTGIERTGTAAGRVPGTFDVFGTLIEARDALLNEGGLSREEQMQRLSGALEGVEAVLDHVTRGMTSVGGRLAALDTLGESLATIQASAEDQAGAIENADLVQVASELSRMQTLYEMTLASTARLLNTSLMNYL